MNKKRVYVDGVFDLFHEGHINLLKSAASFGTLVVGVHSDEFVESYKRRPIIPQDTRYAVVKSCRYVDEVITGVGAITRELIEEYNIDLVIHGDDFAESDIKKHYSPALEKGIFQLIPYTHGVSSSRIISEIEKRFSK